MFCEVVIGNSYANFHLTQQTHSDGNGLRNDNGALSSHFYHPVPRFSNLTCQILLGFSQHALRVMTGCLRGAGTLHPFSRVLRELIQRRILRSDFPSDADKRFQLCFHIRFIHVTLNCYLFPSHK